ncbi:MAG TPA: hypothetical protein VMU47_10935 [Caldimonas sp.]|nr:hypothetical protein [Caldimonas sp.]
MAGFSPFQPQSKCSVVDNSAAVQVQAPSTAGSIQYRIRNRSSSEAYLAWAAPQGGGGATQPTMPSVAPIVGTPQTGVIGMLGSSVETFTLPPNCYFQAITAGGATFEIIAGEGV